MKKIIKFSLKDKDPELYKKCLRKRYEELISKIQTDEEKEELKEIHKESKEMKDIEYRNILITKHEMWSNLYEDMLEYNPKNELLPYYKDYRDEYTQLIKDFDNEVAA